MANEFMQKVLDGDYADACAMLTEDGLLEINAYDASECEQLLPEVIASLPGDTAARLATASFEMPLPPRANADGEEEVVIGADGFPVEGPGYYQHGVFSLVRKPDGSKISEFPNGS